MVFLICLFFFSYLHGMEMVTLELVDQKNKEGFSIDVPLPVFEQCHAYNNYTKNANAASYTEWIRSTQASLPSEQGHSPEYMSEFFKIVQELHNKNRLAKVVDEINLSNLLNDLAIQHTDNTLPDIMKQTLQEKIAANLAACVHSDYRPEVQSKMNNIEIERYDDTFKNTIYQEYHQKCLSLLIKKESIATLLLFIEKKITVPYSSQLLDEEKIKSVISQYVLAENIEDLQEKIKSMHLSRSDSDESVRSETIWYNWHDVLQDTITTYCKNLPPHYPLFFLFDLNYLGFGDRKMRQPIANYLYDCDIYGALKYGLEFPLFIASQPQVSELDQSMKDRAMELIEEGVYSVSDAIANNKGVSKYVRTPQPGLRKNNMLYVTVKNRCIRVLKGLENCVKNLTLEQQNCNLHEVLIENTKVKVVDAQKVESMFLQGEYNQEGQFECPQITLKDNLLRLIVGAPCQKVYYWHLDGIFPDLKIKELCEQEHPYQAVNIIDRHGQNNELLEKMISKINEAREEGVRRCERHEKTINNGLLLLYSCAIFSWFLSPAASVIMLGALIVDFLLLLRQENSIYMSPSCVINLIANKYIKKSTYNSICYTHKLPERD